MISSTLTLLDNWYQEPSEGNHRAKLLSKLAILELCGWLEVWMDELLVDVCNNVLHDEHWTRDQVISKTFGFDYSNHLRPMLSKLLGEHLVRVMERRLDTLHPGDLEQIKSILGSLWKIRCSFAHNDLHQNIVMQESFYAPSWAINQHRIVNKKLDNLKAISIQIAKETPST